MTRPNNNSAIVNILSDEAEEDPPCWPSPPPLSLLPPLPPSLPTFLPHHHLLHSPSRKPSASSHRVKRTRECRALEIFEILSTSFRVSCRQIGCTGDSRGSERDYDSFHRLCLVGNSKISY
ncbi:hypothetical protein E2C01_026245 [Portunus trituberculatus]|uniref:Uncharacterized protein n=1 Tax=Portunus trituberculatus TaxID=210409 RepID=A0A5B7EF66_PORTR|nr:hypothetical protein [Portunus trituberculatus]